MTTLAVRGYARSRNAFSSVTRDGPAVMSCLVDELPPVTEGQSPRKSPFSTQRESGDTWEAESSIDTDQLRVEASDWADTYLRVIDPVIDLMLTLSRRILGDESQAWDAVQEALIALWKKGEIPSNPRAWLSSTVLLRSLHLARSRARRRKHERRACQRKSESSHRDNPSRRIERDELNQVLDDTLNTISPEYVEVFLMRTADGMEYAEIADRLQVPIGTVRSRLNRARQSILTTLSERFPLDEHLLS